MVIVGILIGLSVPAVTSLMSSSGVSAASREVGNMLGLARQVAITQRTYARVVFPYSGTGIHPEMWYQTYAVMTNRNNSLATGWTYMTKWEYLPLGAVFPQTIPGGGLGALNDPNSLSEATLPFPIPANPNNTAPLVYIEFGPTGAATALTSGSGSALAITKGFTAANTGVVTPTAFVNSSNTLIGVDTLVGRIQVVQ